MTKKLDDLGAICENKRGFRDVLQIIRELFIIEPEARLEAGTLWNRMEAIVLRAKRDLRKSPSCYLDDSGFGAPVATPVPPTPQLSRRPSSVGGAPP